MVVPCPGRGSDAAHTLKSPAMDETNARQVLLLRAFETARPAHPLWGEDDRRWASRVALEEAPADDTPERFLARRAAAALRRLGPRESHVRDWLAHPLWRGRWMPAALGLGLMLGLVADALGPAHRISLLAPPVWALVLWNLGVIVLLLLRGLLALRPSASPQPGGLRGWLARRTLDLRSLRRTRRDERRPPPDAPDAPSLASLLDTLAVQWLSLSAPLAGARAALLLHLGAIGVALGVIASLYLRGLVLDYRVGWSSTFLDTGTVHQALSLLLEPAARLSGLSLPDAATLAALRLTEGAPVLPAPGGIDTAAPWIHLWSITLVLAVVLPRALLALLAALQAGWLARRFPLPLTEPYFRELLGQQRREAERPVLLPYAQPVEPARVAALTDLLRRQLGETLALQVAPVRAYGSEDETALQASVAGSPSLLLPLFDLSATPEAEIHGRWLRALMNASAPGGRPGPRIVMLVEDSSFAARFAASAPERLAQRLQAWQALADSLGLGCVRLHEGRPAADDTAAQAVLAGLQSAGGALA